MGGNVTGKGGKINAEKGCGGEGGTAGERWAARCRPGGRGLGRNSEAGGDSSKAVMVARAGIVSSSGVIGVANASVLKRPRQ